MGSRTRRGFGAIRKLPSGRWQASYTGPDGQRHLAPSTFTARKDADAWLAAEQTAISRAEWTRPEPAYTAVPTLSEYATGWLAGRDLRPRTRVEYRRLLDGLILPTLGRRPLDVITPAAVRTWHTEVGQATGPTRQAHAYALLRTILGTAVTDDIVPTNPCRIRGAGGASRARKVRPASLPELAAIAGHVRAEYAPAILLAAWCGLRFGELAELRRGDVEPDGSRITVERAVGVVDGEFVVGPPKTDAGVRKVAVPPHLRPVLVTHLAGLNRHTGTLLFPSPSGEHLRSDGALHRDFYAARTAAGRPDLRIHDLRHTGATLAAATGATLAELMHRLGHSTASAAMRYQHAVEDRDVAIAAALSEFAAANVVQLRPRQTTTG